MNNASFVKGLAAGLLVGSAVVMVCDPINDRQRRRLQKKTQGVFRSIGNVIDTAVDIRNNM